MPKLQIAEIRTASSEEWDFIVSHSEAATFFHSREWVEIWRDYTHGNIRAAPLMVTFSDGAKVLFPRCLRRLFKGVLAQSLSSPEWTFGGWLCTDRLTAEHHRALWQIAAKLDLELRRNPFDPTFFLEATPGIEVIGDTTQAIDLRTIEVGEEGWTCRELHHKARGQMRSSIRKARDAGVVVAQATNKDDWLHYYEMYEASQKRWGSVLGQPHRCELFEIIYERHSPQIKLWLARIDGKAVSGAICFYNNKHVVYWHGASLADHAALRPANLLQAHLIEDAYRNGFWWYDFNPSGGLEGVEKFKTSFGAKKLPAEMITCRNLQRRMIDFARLSLHRLGA